MELHPATLWEAISDVVPDRLGVVQGSVGRTWRDFDDRSARLAGALLAHGIGEGAKVGQLLYNCPEFLESYFAALKIRAVPFNINYRYTADEIAYLLVNADAEVLVYPSSLGERVAGAVASAGALKLLVEVADDAAHMNGSLRYEEAIAEAEASPRIERGADDVILIYTGGTTGKPKGVVTKVGALVATSLELIPPLIGRAPLAVDEVPSFSSALSGTDDLMVALPAAPLMHNTGMNIGALAALNFGGTVVLLEGRRFDPSVLWDTVATERVNAITIVGDAFARPMVAALEDVQSRDLGCVRFIASSGAMFSAEVKARLLQFLPRATIIDLIGSTEAPVGMSIATADAPVQTARFQLFPGVILVTEDGRRVEPGSDEPGLIAAPGGAEGYYKDDTKTAATFKVINGIRYTIPGDRATLDAAGTLTLLGRDSSCINTAGEKVYAEEVEETLKALPSVEDALVFGITDERLGEKVAAILSRVPAADDPVDAILAAARHKLAPYKLPRAVMIVDEVPRTEIGKPDYPAARALFEAKAHDNGIDAWLTD